MTGLGECRLFIGAHKERPVKWRAQLVVPTVAFDVVKVPFRLGSLTGSCWTLEACRLCFVLLPNSAALHCTVRSLPSLSTCYSIHLHHLRLCIFCNLPPFSLAFPPQSIPVIATSSLSHFSIYPLSVSKKTPSTFHSPPSIFDHSSIQRIEFHLDPTLSIRPLLERSTLSLRLFVSRHHH